MEIIIRINTMKNVNKVYYRSATEGGCGRRKRTVARSRSSQKRGCFNEESTGKRILRVCVCALVCTHMGAHAYYVS